MELRGLQVLFLKEREAWVALCLSPFSVGQANTPEAALQELLRMLQVESMIAQKEGATPFAEAFEAPLLYQELFARAQLRLSCLDPSALDLPEGTLWEELLGELRLAA